jgi:hypothetical protein
MSLQRRRMKKTPEEQLVRAMDDLIPSHATVNELGAGTGRYVQAIRDTGRLCKGWDGTKGIEVLTDGLVQHADFTRGPDRAKITRAEWTICLEVGEHIPRQYEDALFRLISDTTSDGVILSWATPGQRGEGHVNCHTPEYLCCKMAGYGWEFMETDTLLLRAAAGRSWRRKICVFGP